RLPDAAHEPVERSVSAGGYRQRHLEASARGGLHTRHDGRRPAFDLLSDRDGGERLGKRQHDLAAQRDLARGDAWRFEREVSGQLQIQRVQRAELGYVARAVAIANLRRRQWSGRRELAARADRRGGDELA